VTAAPRNDIPTEGGEAQVPEETTSASTAIAVVKPTPLVPVEPAQVTVSSSQVEAAPPPAPEPVTNRTPESPKPDLDQVIRESGLQMVQTKPGAAIDVPDQPEFVPAKRPRRAPPPDLGQPLQIVETRKE